VLAKRHRASFGRVRPTSAPCARDLGIAAGATYFGRKKTTLPPGGLELEGSAGFSIRGYELYALNGNWEASTAVIVSNHASPAVCSRIANTQFDARRQREPAGPGRLSRRFAIVYRRSYRYFGAAPRAGKADSQRRFCCAAASYRPGDGNSPAASLGRRRGSARRIAGPGCWRGLATRGIRAPSWSFHGLLSAPGLARQPRFSPSRQRRSRSSDRRLRRGAALRRDGRPSCSPIQRASPDPTRIFSKSGARRCTAVSFPVIDSQPWVAACGLLDLEAILLGDSARVPFTTCSRPRWRRTRSGVFRAHAFRDSQPSSPVRGVSIRLSTAKLELAGFYDRRACGARVSRAVVRPGIFRTAAGARGLRFQGPPRRKVSAPIWPSPRGSAGVSSCRAVRIF
jgi:hypothetical protein